MGITIESPSELERKLHIRIDLETFERHVSAEIQNQASKINLKGFRRGKVPNREVRRRFGKEIRMRVALSLSEGEIRQCVDKHRFNPAGMSRIEVLNYDAEADLEAICTLHIYPNIEFDNLDRIQVERPKVDIEERDIQKVVNRMRRDYAPRVPVERKPQDGDRVKIRIVRNVPNSTEQSMDRLDDKEHQQDEYEYEVGALKIDQLQRINSAIRDMQIGEERQVTIDHDYFLWEVDEKPQLELEQEMAEQEMESIEFTVKLLEVSAPNVNALGDDWFKQLLGSLDSESDLYSYIRENMEDRIEVESMETLADQVFFELQRLYRVPIPSNLLDGMVDQALERKSRTAGTIEHRKHDHGRDQVHDGDRDDHDRQSDDQHVHVEEPIKQPTELDASELEEIEDHLLRRVHTYAFAFARKIEVSSARVQVEVEKRMARWLSQWISNSRMQEQLRSDYTRRIYYKHMERQVVQEILDEATVKDAPCSYSDLISGKFQPSHIQS